MRLLSASFFPQHCFHNQLTPFKLWRSSKSKCFPPESQETLIQQHFLVGFESLLPKFTFPNSAESLILIHIPWFACGSRADPGFCVFLITSTDFFAWREAHGTVKTQILPSTRVQARLFPPGIPCICDWCHAVSHPWWSMKWQAKHGPIKLQSWIRKNKGASQCRKCIPAVPAQQESFVPSSKCFFVQLIKLQWVLCMWLLKLFLIPCVWLCSREQTAHLAMQHNCKHMGAKKANHFHWVWHHHIF